MSRGRYSKPTPDELRTQLSPMSAIKLACPIAALFTAIALATAPRMRRS